MSSVFFKFNWNFNQNSNLNLPYLISFIFFIFPFATSGSFFNNYNSIILWIFLSFIFFKEKKIKYYYLFINFFYKNIKMRREHTKF